MAGTSDPRQPLPDWILECYDQLRTHVCDLETDGVQAIDREEAIDVLVSDGGDSLEPDDAKYALDRLLERGYFYEVDTELRVTTPEEQCSS